MPACASTAPATSLTPDRSSVLVTRPEAAGSETARRLTALGWQPIATPIIEIVPRLPAPPMPVRAALVTSRHAVPGLPAGIRTVFAVGDATAAAARTRGVAEVHSAAGDAVALADLVSRTVQPAEGPLLLACGAGHARPLATALRALGFTVRRRIVYESRPVPVFPAAGAVGITTGLVHAALFLSAETARGFILRLPTILRPALTGIEALALSSAVAEAAAPLPWRSIRVASRPDQDALLALLPPRATRP